MLTLGIETSCDETAIALIRGKKVLAEAVASSARDHSPYGGVVPEIASRRHLETLLPCLDTVLTKAKVPLSRIGLIAVTLGPGLMGSLLVGVSCAKTLALLLKKPVVGVDHVLAHAFSGQLMQRNPRFPFVALVVSGGHTLLLLWKAQADLRILGRTYDDAAGEAFDKVAKMMDLGYPGGPIIDRLSQGSDPSKFRFPRPWIQEKHFNFSFSGLKTSVLYKIQEIEKRRKLTDKDKREIAAGFQEAVCDVLIKKALRASEAHHAQVLVVGGGVSANSRLKKRLESAGRELGVKVVFPTLKLAVDNATMIAALGQAMYHSKPKSFRPLRMKKTLKLQAYSDFFIPKGKLLLIK